MQIGKNFTQINAWPKGGLSSDTIVNLKNEAQVLLIVTRSGKTLWDHLIEDLGEKVPKVKPKDVPPKYHEEEENENESIKFDDELHRKEKGDKLKKFMTKLSNLSINIPLLEVIQEILGYAKLMKNLMSKKKLIKGHTLEVTHGCSIIVSSKVVEKKEDPRAFTIPCTIGTYVFAKALCDLGASINLVPFAIYKNLRLDALNPTSMRLLMEDWSIKRLIRILFDVLVIVEKFILPTNFVVLNCEMHIKLPIILGRPFLATGRAIIDLEMGEMKFKVHKDEVSFKVCKIRKQPTEIQVIFLVDVEIEEVKKGDLRTHLKKEKRKTSFHDDN
ncbi:uncharacterized protein LOC124887101 [Capsicum annuum]|uniref:uncharacterized protein LOC124887101 n=1 Tax=Capsicum annuum TaxID=4072 RepID=UPI001FB1732E|nr:uncharacterized protein LOC124887101 [Capsicum annuum]